MPRDNCVFKKISASISSTNSLIVNICVETSIAGTIQIKYGPLKCGKEKSLKYVKEKSLKCVKEKFIIASTDTKSSTHHTLTIGRLRALTEYKYRAYLTVPGPSTNNFIKIYRSSSQSFTTGKLPEKLTTSLSLNLAKGRFSDAAGVIILCIAGVSSPPDFFQGYVGVDQDGEVVWYYQSPSITSITPLELREKSKKTKSINPCKKLSKAGEKDSNKTKQKNLNETKHKDSNETKIKNGFYTVEIENIKDAKEIKNTKDVKDVIPRMKAGQSSPFTPAAGDFFQLSDGNFLITRGYALGLPNSAAGIFQAPQMEIITPAGELVNLQSLVCKTRPEKIGTKGATIAKFGWSHAAFQDPVSGLVYNLGQELKDPFYDANLAPPRIVDSNISFAAGTRMQLGATVRVWNPCTGKQKVLTSDFKLLNPFTYRGTLSDQSASAPVDCDGKSPGLENQDWTHGNAISRLTERSNYFISERNTSAVLILDPKNFKLLYKFGPTKPSDFKFANPDDKFYNQHDAHEIFPFPYSDSVGPIIDNRVRPIIDDRVRCKTSRLLMFDDGTTRPESEGGKYGRGIEYELDYKNRIIRKVWEFRPTVNLECDDVGSARRLKNGNTIVDFGASNLTVKHVFEAGRKSNTLVADLEVSSPLPDNTWILYRAVPIQSIFGETIVS